MAVKKSAKPALEAAVTKHLSKFEALRAEIGKAIVGQDDVVEELLVAIFARGHCILEGVPGLAKTLLVRTLAGCLDLDFNRIQFTPDLMPADITGTEVIHEDQRTRRRSFRFLEGPLFANVILADEINRTPPKTQAALLEAMQERQVTVGGERHALPDPFFVLATQNPIEQEGTYPLPEAQLDRFLVQVDIGYPPQEAERRMLFSTTGNEEAPPRQAMTDKDLIAAQQLTRTIPVGEQVVDAILRVVRAARPGPDSDTTINSSVAWGPSPRASQALMLGARAKALLDGRLAPSIDDVADLLEPVFKHRMALNFQARADGRTIAETIAHLKTFLA
jgi:MoxR-like ATPase